MIRRIFPGSIAAGISRAAKAIALTGMLIAASQAPAHALVLFTMRQVGDDLQVTASGTYTKAGLNFVNAPQPPYAANPETISAAEFNGFFNYLLVGPELSGSDVFIWGAASLTQLEPATNPFASDIDTTINGSTSPAGSSSLIGIDPTLNYILLPTGNGEGDPSCIPSCSVTPSTTTFLNNSIATLGLRPGTYTWTWAAGGNDTGDFNQTFQLTIEPVPGPLPALGGAAAFAWSRRLRRRVKAIPQSGSQLTGV